MEELQVGMEEHQIAEVEISGSNFIPVTMVTLTCGLWLL